MRTRGWSDAAKDGPSEIRLTHIVVALGPLRPHWWAYLDLGLELVQDGHLYSYGWQAAGTE